MDVPASATAAAAPYESGDIIAGKYALVQVIGEGGMGAVWLARNVVLEVDVAVKLIRRDMATPETAERLLQEARAAARIDHPSVVRIFDFGETELDDPFIVMERLAGGSLRDLLNRKRRLPPENAVRMMLPVASAFVAAHARGVVHRDLKPENILLVGDERGPIVPKVVDFGIAKLDYDDIDRRVTAAGALLGSPDYMSPEQARGRDDVDERTDVWSFCVVLYEAITGQRPFLGANYNAVLAAIVEDAPPPITELSDADAALWAILERGLAKDRQQRWQSMQDLGRALAEWVLDRGGDTDVTGVSLVIHWLDIAGRRSLSEPPLPVTAEGLKRASLASVPEVPVPVTVEGSLASSPPPRFSRASWAHVPPSRRRAALAIVAAAALGVAGLVGLRALRGPAAPVPPTPSPAPAQAIATEPSPPPKLPAPLPAPLPSAAPEPTAEAAPDATEAPVAAPPRAEDPTTCAIRHFPAGAFPPGSRADLAGMCTETDPRRGATAMKERVVVAARRAATDATREWALLHWYEMASFAVVRARCCPSPPPLHLPPPVGACAPLDRSLDDLGAVAAGAGDVEKAIAGYRAAVRCALASGGAVAYRYKGLPQGGAETALRKTIARGGGGQGGATPAP